MNPAPSVIVFDVNETLSDLAPMGRRFSDVGAPPQLAQVWFTTLLRDGFARTVAGSPERFRAVGTGALRSLLAGVSLDRRLDAAVDHVMAGFDALPVHSDVADGVRALRTESRRLVTLSNGAAEIADELLTAAGIRDEFDQLLSVEQAGAWKPARGAYELAAQACGTSLGDMMLVAAHPWDIDGADRAGMATAWINRTGTLYPSHFRPAQHIVTSVSELAGVLGD